MWNCGIKRLIKLGGSPLSEAKTKERNESAKLTTQRGTKEKLIWGVDRMVYPLFFCLPFIVHPLPFTIYILLFTIR